MMKIAIDIHHAADINFFKNSIGLLRNKGVYVELIVRPRGKIVPILQKELPDIPLKIIGMHYSPIRKKILYGIKREIELLLYLKKVKFDVGVAFGPEICYVSLLLGKPSMAFTDEYEYKLTTYLSKFAATCFAVPDCIPASGKNIYKFKGLKELAYLHPNYFKPNMKILEDYGLNPNEYVFIREIASTSLNYRDASSKLHEITQYFNEIGLRPIVSLEDKNLIEKFRHNCIILNEPINDIYSLMFFAALTISSGDTVARESCLVGTPVIYTGGRDMYVQRELIKKGCMYKATDKFDIIKIINYILNNDIKNNTIEIINYNINNKWDNITEVIVEKIMNLKK